MSKLILSVLALFLIGLVLPRTESKVTPTQEQVAAREDVLFNTTLLGRARKAKAKGITKIAFQGPTGIPVVVRDWDDVLANFSIIAAEPISKTSVLLDPHHIGTFYKVKVTENLSQSSVNGCCGIPNSVPSELPALAAGEMYVFAGGGTVTLDGVEVTQAGLFSEVQLSEPYLFFLSHDPSKRIGVITLGHRGIFKITPNGELTSVDGRPNNIKRFLDDLYGSSLGRLREGLTAMRT